MAESLAVGIEEGKAWTPKDLTADDVTKAYRSIAGHAALVAGTIGSSPGDSTQPAIYSVRTEWSQRDIDRKEKTRFSKTFSLLEAGDKLSCVGSSAPQEFTHVLWNVPSPSGKKRAVVLKKKDKKADDKQFVEIWNTKQKEKTIDIKALEKHSDIVGSDGQFGSVQWSKCENYLLYLAEKKRPKAVNFFEAASAKDGKDKGDSSEETVKGGEFFHRESWGEQLAERHVTVVCRLTLSSSVVTLLTQVPDHLSPGQVVWGPDNDVVFAAWSHVPYRLGLKFCVERRSFLFKASFDGGECETLSQNDRAVRCPSFSPDQSRLVYLDTAEGGAHNQCSRLMMIDWKKWMGSQNKEDARQVIVDIVSSPYKAGYDPGQEEFPGLYTWADQGAQQNWLSDNVHVLFTSYCRSRSSVFMINTDTKDVRTLYPFDPCPFKTTPVPAARPLPLETNKLSAQSTGSTTESCAWSCSLLDVRGMDVLISCSWPNTPSFPVLGRLSGGQGDRCQWVRLGHGEKEPVVLGHYNWTVWVLHPRDLQAQHKDYEHLDFEAILYMPLMEGKQESKPPLVLFPHGGPHSVFDSSFMLNPAVFATCGFAVMCVNYRGSIGFGQDNISSLLGNVGNFDVKDCMLALQSVQQANLVDPDNTFVYGGSHGGFLLAHLIGQYPDVFRAASMRNPVINLTSMVGTTDIPDWVFTEAGLKFDFSSQADADVLPRLWRASPVSHVHKVKTPVMLHIGLKDLRVPPSQGLEFYKMLKARDVPVQCHTYPDSNHSLAEVEVEADSLVHSVLWFAKHLS